MPERNYSFIDKVLSQLDTGLQTVFSKPETTRNINFSVNNKALDHQTKKISSSLMRVNHSGEVCAQALYQGQAVFARDEKIKDSLIQASLEENDHLNWCKTRLEQLDSHTSALNPLWYTGSFILGMSASLCGDKWSLGFLAETEKQVAKHLEHLVKLPHEDQISRSIIQQMKTDETQHAMHAIDQGGEQLPKVICKFMKLISKVMTVSSYYI